MKYRFICIPLVILLFIACIPSAYAMSYSDVDRARLGVEAFEAIMYVTDNGIMSGVGNSMFSPSSSVTRAQIVQILYNMAGNPSVSGSNPFNDVSLTAWYRPAVQWAYSNGIANTFSPDAGLSQILCKHREAVQNSAKIFQGGSGVSCRRHRRSRAHPAAKGRLSAVSRKP